ISVQARGTIVTLSLWT
nr:immunoglobulin heavy chain junction region [Mus musculus]